jgi:hypothetical protein
MFDMSDEWDRWRCRFDGYAIETLCDFVEDGVAAYDGWRKGWLITPSGGGEPFFVKDVDDMAGPFDELPEGERVTLHQALSSAQATVRGSDDMASELQELRLEVREGLEATHGLDGRYVSGRDIYGGQRWTLTPKPGPDSPATCSPPGALWGQEGCFHFPAKICPSYHLIYSTYVLFMRSCSHGRHHDRSVGHEPGVRQVPAQGLRREAGAGGPRAKPVHRIRGAPQALLSGVRVLPDRRHDAGHAEPGNALHGALHERYDHGLQVLPQRLRPRRGHRRARPLE